MTLRCIYTSFEKTELEVREKTAFNADDLKSFLKLLKQESFAEEFFIISTCNRTEIYYWNQVDQKKLFIELLCNFKDDSYFKDHSRSFHTINSTEKSATRLYKVSNGVLSQVLGDLQIIGQVKHAYRIASMLKCTGPILHKLLQSVFSSYKEIATTTKLHSGSASISYAAMELTRDFLKKRKDNSILVVGAGRFSEEVITGLQKKGFSNITIVNRTNEKATMLAEKYQLNVIPFDDLEDTWCYDVIISCVSAGNYIIDENIFEINPSSTKLIVDLSVPRSISPRIGDKQGIKLVNLSHIQEKNNLALKERKQALPQVNRIIKIYCLDFFHFLKTTKSRPVIHQLKKLIAEITMQEMRRHSKKIKSADMENEMIEFITKNIINKIIKRPAKQLSTNGKEVDKLSEALIKLFELTPQKIPTQKH